MIGTKLDGMLHVPIEQFVSTPCLLSHSAFSKYTWITLSCIPMCDASTVLVHRQYGSLYAGDYLGTLTSRFLPVIKNLLRGLTMSICVCCMSVFYH